MCSRTSRPSTRRRSRGTYDITALSIHGYAHLADRYALMPSGASFGDGYGPVVVSREPRGRDGAGRRRGGHPGTADDSPPGAQAVAARRSRPGSCRSTASSTRWPAGTVDAGVVIHEGQLTFGDMGLTAEVDLGAWWQEETGGPLPLGGNGIRKDLPVELQRRLCRLLRQSIDYALENRDEALELRPPLRPRHRGRRRAQRPVRRHVRQPLDPGLRRRGPAGGAAAARSGPRAPG